MSVSESIGTHNVTKQSVAAQLGVSTDTIDRWCRQGQFPLPIRLGDSRNSPLRWNQSKVDVWVRDRKISKEAV